MLLPQKILENLPPTSIDMDCKSLVENHKKRNISLDYKCLAEFIANYNIKTCKIYKCVKVIHWVCFNVHKNPENHYRELLLLLKPFHESKIDLKIFIIFAKMHIQMKKITLKK